MRRLFLVAGLALLAGLAAGCMSDDENARRPAAMSETREASYSRAQLSLGGQDTVWRSFTWSVGADVVESKATDAEGNPVYRLSAGAAKPGTLTLERGLTTDSSQLAGLFSSGQLDFNAGTLSLFDANGAQFATYTLSDVVIVDLKHRSSETLVLETLTVRFASASLQL